MKMKKWFGLLFLGLALITLAACGQKTPEDIIKTELKDSYTGYSNSKSYQGLMFIGGEMYSLLIKKKTVLQTRMEKKFISQSFLKMIFHLLPKELLLSLNLNLKEQIILQL
ncbi:lipoprotein [Streptococcus agalactiae]|uniref:Lipoprotein n=1 Tax=Streptococcus agalactiae TaxID=1311 RepID=A0AB38VKV2_STRAG|nr:lipoprotein [Streptococcus agalactiae]